MESVIFYFSGTGNSLKIARDLAQEIGNTSVVPIKKVIREQLETPMDCGGIVFPCYFGALPPIIPEFIKRLSISQINYIYAVVTYNDFPGGALSIIERTFKKEGKNLSAGFAISMPGNYVPLYAPLPKDKQEERFNNAKLKVINIAKVVKNQEKKLEISWFGRFLSFMQKRNNKKLPERDKRFWTDKNCNSCGICERICPVENIEMVEGRPRWLHKCQQCLACLHWCPEASIQVGEKTMGRARYQNPEIKLKDLL
jgi:Pyruvate/2-oxoacid:ferredoxin oxidoreductase delta subunit